MDFDHWLTHISKKANTAQVAATGVVLLFTMQAAYHVMQTRAAELDAGLQSLIQARDQSALAASHFRGLAELKTQDLNNFKRGMANLAQSNKTLFEAGLSLHEEKRLLEKQWEIMTTYLSVDPALQRIFLMRGDQPLESYLIHYVPIKALGGVPTTVPNVVRIISKERFANPERGISEMVNGKLQWEPPQVGTSVRSNALGEYVLFTNSKLILHGPPVNPVDHEAFPHLCLGLSLEAARNLYQHSFIGTKILLTSVKEEMVRQNAPFEVNIASATPKEAP
jgi:hypothetical protein